MNNGFLYSIDNGYTIIVMILLHTAIIYFHQHYKWAYVYFKLSCIWAADIIFGTYFVETNAIRGGIFLCSIESLAVLFNLYGEPDYDTTFNDFKRLFKDITEIFKAHKIVGLLLFVRFICMLPLSWELSFTQRVYCRLTTLNIIVCLIFYIFLIYDLIRNVKNEIAPFAC